MKQLNHRKQQLITNRLDFINKQPQQNVQNSLRLGIHSQFNSFINTLQTQKQNDHPQLISLINQIKQDHVEQMNKTFSPLQKFKKENSQIVNYKQWNSLLSNSWLFQQNHNKGMKIKQFLINGRKERKNQFRLSCDFERKNSILDYSDISDTYNASSIKPNSRVMDTSMLSYRNSFMKHSMDQDKNNRNFLQSSGTLDCTQQQQTIEYEVEQDRNKTKSNSKRFSKPLNSLHKQ